MVNDQFIPDQIAAIYDLIRNVVVGDLDWPEVSELIACRQWHNQNQTSAPAYGIALPILTCLAVGGKTDEAVPVAAAWALIELASHILDDLQDQDNDQAAWSDWPPAKSALISTTLVLAAQASLAELSVDTRAKSDILRSLSGACMQAAQAQLASPRTTSLEAYFKHIIAKAGILVAAVAYAGARAHTDNAEALQGMHNFGLNLGILMQLNDDLRDLSTSSMVNDLHAGYYSLPVLQALTQTEHPHQVRLKHLLADESLTTEGVTEIVNILVDMGSFSFANTMAQVYRQKALQCLDLFPAENVVYLKDFLECFLEIDTKSA